MGFTANPSRKDPANAMTAASLSSSHAALGRFSDAVRLWFLDTFQEPTSIQENAWDAIGRGENALVIAPTGSGKTLAAFLFAIDSLMREKAAGEQGTQGVRVLYISPLKALGADVQRNLQEPLAGIAQRMVDEGTEVPLVRTGMRTGDTTPEQRRALQRTPPDILITTPESLYLMLTSKTREILRSVETVIVDEVHALAGSKRGSHLALSLERLDELLEHPAQRIGLSATVRPRDEVARFLGGVHPVQIVAGEGRTDLDVRVVVPVRDMTAVPAHRGFESVGPTGMSGAPGGKGGRRPSANAAWKSDRTLRAAMAKESSGTSGHTPDSRLGSTSIWPYIEASILDEVLAHRSTIVFVNSRGLCEKLTARLNELYAKREGLLLGEPTELQQVPSHIRSDLGSTSELTQGAQYVVAKAHHGSVSKEKRLQVEEELKRGQLPCVVATSSLELGIDMGSIDLVLQVAAPPSVASALQRIGRANHQVGGRSDGIIYPRTRNEIIDAAVVAEGMRAGSIEATSLVKNPLDVLAQQTVAAVAMGPLAADTWYATVCRTASFSDLPRRVFDSVLDMLAGRHASGDLTEFAPRIVWNRQDGMLSPRPGTQRQAVTSAGTIPDRGMFSVVLPEADGNQGRRRVGELDEEMVYESRVGDIIALGTSSWRIREITRDRVIVDPAPGRSARLPFWHGEGVGRPAETGRMRGAFLRAVGQGIEGGDDAAPGGSRLSVDAKLQQRLKEDGLDNDAQQNLVELIRVQREATGVVPDDKTLVVERCEDETGDWRVMLHSPYGRRVHEPWAMAVSDRVSRTLGFDPQAMAADDGILLRVPMTETRLPGAELFVFDPDELDRIVRERVDATSLFAARFRECAARALLMSPIAPGKRAPLWQQRLKAGQLLEAARREQDFPILLETARECLQDVYDMPALHELMEGVQAGSVRLVEAQTSIPSPFAAPLLFGYVGEHLYLGDMPHAERRASLLSLDPTLLGELLGSGELSQLLDDAVLHSVEEKLQRLSPDRRARGVEGVADLLRTLGPLRVEELAQRLTTSVEVTAVDAESKLENSDTELPGDGEACGSPSCSAPIPETLALLEELQSAQRVFLTAIGGTEYWVYADDTPRLHEALGIAAPAGAFAMPGDVRATDEASRHPLDSLVARYARTHGPFSTDELAQRFGIGSAVVRESLHRLSSEGAVMAGRFGCKEGETAEREWVSSEVFRRLRSLSLAKARKAVRAVSQDAYVRYLLDLQGVGALNGERFEGVDGLARVIAQFEGVFLPAAAWESYVFPARVAHFRPSMLDELLSSGDVVWVGGRRDAGDDKLPVRLRGPKSKAAMPVGLVAFFPTDSPLAPLQPSPIEASETISEPNPAGEASKPSVEEVVAEVLGCGGGLFFRYIVDAVRRRFDVGEVDEDAIAVALQHLIWSGRATNDTFAPIRAANEGTSTTRPRSGSRRRASSRRSHTRYAEMQATARSGFATHSAAVSAQAAALSGRWSLLEASSENDTVRLIAAVESIFDRYGVLTRDAVELSGVPGGLSALIPVLRLMEDAGDVLRGAFVEGFGPAQFAARETIDVLRTYAASTSSKESVTEAPETVVLAADDPACLFGAGIPWPAVVGNGEPVETSVADQDPSEDGEAHSLRPSRRAGSLVVVREGRAVLYVTVGLRAVLSFTVSEDELREAVGALVAFLTRAAKREGGSSARKKMVVETFNGLSVLDTPFADLLQSMGFVRLPDGMRFYVDPFA